MMPYEVESLPFASTTPEPSAYSNRSGSSHNGSHGNALAAYCGPMTNQPDSAEKSGPCQIIKLDPEVSPCSEIGVSERDPLTGNTELLCAAHLALREAHVSSS